MAQRTPRTVAPERDETDVILKPPRLPSGPWIYRKMVTFPSHGGPPGSYVGLRARDGRLLARGFVNRRSEVAFRVLGGPDAPSDFRTLLQARLARALALRRDVLRLPAQTSAWRLVNSEGDDLSGLVVDRYGSTCVASIYSAGFVVHGPLLEASLMKIEGIERVLVRSDDRTQELEGFRLPPLPPNLEETIHEGSVRYRVDLSEGHKTGLFLDQRDNRRLVAERSAGGTVLDLCTNAGGFALAAAAQGRPRRIVGLDLDEKALARARGNARLNGARVDWVHADLFPWLRDRTAAKDQFDVVVLDPAKLARGKTEVPKALDRYRDMNTLAMQAVKPGGLMFTCSCSGAVSEADFVHTVKRAAGLAGRTAQIIETRGAASDHPIALEFLEGRYLKALLLRVL